MTDLHRLHSISPAIADLANGLLPHEQRNLCVFACLLAISKARVLESLVHESLALIKKGEKLNGHTMVALCRLADQYDQAYFVKSNQDDWRRARAIAAVTFAGDLQPPGIVLDCLYEAFMACYE